MPKVELVCAECGKKYERWPSQVEGSRFCGKKCLQTWLNREVRSKHKAPWLRELNKQPGRNAAIARKSAGKRRRKRERKRKLKSYKKKKQFGHSVSEHRIIAERIAGRQLGPDEMVHHVDGNKHNNTPENLAIGISARQHRNYHVYLRSGNRKKVLNLVKVHHGIQMKYKFKTTPYRHQVKALKKIIINRGGGLFMDMGTGKTKVALDFCGAAAEKWGARRIVIVCPKSVISVWKNEIKKHVPDRFGPILEFRVLNYDKLPHTANRVGMVNELVDWEPDIVILDEAHKIKNPSAKRTKAAIRLGAAAKYRLILTGTPVTKNPIDLFAQFKFLDEGILGSRVAHFKRRYVVYGGYGGYEIQRYINLDELKQKVKPHIFEIKKEECLDLPTRTHEVVPVRLEKRAREIYDSLANESLVEFEGQEVEAPIVLTRLLRLSQIAGGHIKVGDDYKRISTAKQRACLGILEELQAGERQKVVIFARFINELKDAAVAAKKAGYKTLLFHGKTPEKKRENALMQFHESKEPTCFIAQIGTGSLGISLTAAAEAIFYSHSYDYAEFAQAQDRLHRIGQHMPVTYYHLLVRDSIDYAVWMALKSKKNVADLILKNPKLLMEEGYKK